jgi:hypothetical protein
MCNVFVFYDYLLMMRIHNKSFVFFAIPITLILSSCGGTAPDIKAAQQLAKIQEQGKIIFPSIADDVYKSCNRTAELTLLSPPTAVKPRIDEDRQNARKVCQGSPAEASDALNVANQVILDYLDALGKLASEDLTNFDKELNAIGSSLQKLPGLGTTEKKEAVDAGTAIAKFLFKAATNAYRREQLREAVIAVDAPLQVLVNALEKAVSQHYLKGVLENEQVAIDSYYKFYLGQVLTAPLSESSSAKVETVTGKDAEWKATNNTIVAKKTVAKGYTELLKKIARDHNALKKMYVAGEEPSPFKVSQMIDAYSKDVKSLSEKSKQLFARK